ncbi:MAG TPA: hypothetical protein DD490_12755 [Acidobacteria bacterium]|nr:hypothetical protein [Acidobacteriota bacterium]
MRRGGLLLFGHVVALDGEELVELSGGEDAEGDQDLAEPACALLVAGGGLVELLLGDELVVQGDAPEQEVVWTEGHGSRVVERRLRRQPGDRC